jgi:hypothetical protein
MQITKTPTLEKNVCFEDAVVEMNMRIGDDDVGVEKSLKKNEKRKATKKKGKKPPMSHFSSIPHAPCIQKSILLDIHPRILIFSPYIIFTKKEWPIFYTYLSYLSWDCLLLMNPSLFEIFYNFYVNFI